MPSRRAAGVTHVGALDVLLAVSLLGVAGITIAARDAFAAAVGFVAFGLLLAVVWVRIAAPDVALTEAAIGGGLTGGLLVAASSRLGRGEPLAQPGVSLRLAAAAACALVMAGLAAVVLSLPEPAPTLAPLAAADPSQVSLTFDHEPGGRMLDLGEIVAAAPPGSHFYACGPAPMLDAYEAATARLPRERVHLERFTGTGEAVRANGSGFDVALARSERTLHVSADKSILDVLLDEGVDVAFSCMDGVCGSCKVEVLEGLPDHRDVVLSAEQRAANRTMMVCCSRAFSERLVLDL